MTLLARCIQHEFDHLNGVLYYDHIDKKDPFKEGNQVELKADLSQEFIEDYTENEKK